jgi:hypothetical protein
MRICDTKLVWLMISCALGVLSLSAQEPAQVSEGARNARLAVFEACTATLTNIQNELYKLAGAFPSLSGIGEAKPRNGEPFSSTTNRLYRVHHDLQYSKGVRVEKTGPGPDGSISASGERLVFEKGGVLFQLFIVDRPIKVASTGLHRLPIGRGDNQMRLIYNLEEDSKDPVLESAVQHVVERNVSVLRNALETLAATNSSLSADTVW